MIEIWYNSYVGRHNISIWTWVLHQTSQHKDLVHFYHVYKISSSIIITSIHSSTGNILISWFMCEYCKEKQLHVTYDTFSGLTGYTWLHSILCLFMYVKGLCPWKFSCSNSCLYVNNIRHYDNHICKKSIFYYWILEQKQHGLNSVYGVHESRRLFRGNTISENVYMHIYLIYIQIMTCLQHILDKNVIL